MCRDCSDEWYIDRDGNLIYDFYDCHLILQTKISNDSDRSLDEILEDENA